MTATQRLLERLGRRLVEWSSAAGAEPKARASARAVDEARAGAPAQAVDEAGAGAWAQAVDEAGTGGWAQAVDEVGSEAWAPPGAGAGAAAPARPVARGAPFDAKQHWLDRVAHLPPQAWEHGARPVLPGRVAARAPSAQVAVTAPDAPSPPSPVLPQRRPGVEADEAAMAPVRHHDLATSLQTPPRGAENGADRGPGSTAAASVGRAGPIEAPPPIADRSLPRWPAIEPAVIGVKPVAPPSARLQPSPGNTRPASATAAPGWPVEREVILLPRLAQAPLRGPPPIPADRTRAQSATGRADQADDRRNRFADSIALKVDEPKAPDRAATQPPSPVAGFDSKRTHAPDLPQPALARAAPPPAAVPRPPPTAPQAGRRHERRRPDRSIDLHPPARGWPDLPPWPAPADPQAPTASEPHARQRRQRLEREQRG